MQVSALSSSSCLCGAKAAKGANKACLITSRSKTLELYCRQLSLSTNSLEKISSLSGMENLKILALGRNQIKKIENLDSVAETLEELWISYNVLERLVRLIIYDFYSCGSQLFAKSCTCSSFASTAYCALSPLSCRMPVPAVKAYTLTHC